MIWYASLTLKSQQLADLCNQVCDIVKNYIIRKEQGVVADWLCEITVRIALLGLAYLYRGSF